MVDTDENEMAALPSIDDIPPEEEGGPVARSGFTYQDYVAARFLVQMIDDSTIVKVHCETQDDIIVVRVTPPQKELQAEFVQVKTSNRDSLWSAAKLCNRINNKPTTSIFEKSLLKDKAQESACFRIVTSQDVTKALRPLTFQKGHPARALSCDSLVELKSDIDDRCPGVESAKGNGSAYWLDKVCWDVQGAREALERSLLFDVLQLSIGQGRTLLLEQAEKLVIMLLHWVKQAGDASWIPDKSKKIISRKQVVKWWDETVDRELKGPSTVSGGNLDWKLKRASAEAPTVALANELRRDYAAELRSPQYMQDFDQERIPRMVRSKLLSLRAAYESGELAMSPSQFHAHCVQMMDGIGEGIEGNQSAFAKGCMYDMTDRCLMTYHRESL